MGEKLMLGGEFTDLTRSADSPHGQFFPATIHWQMPNGDVGWVFLKIAPNVDARAHKNRLEISATGDSTFRLSAEGLEQMGVTRDEWKLPGLYVKVETYAKDFSVLPGGGYLDLQYRGATHIVLQTSPRH